MVYLYPYHNSGLLQVGLISGSIVLYMILPNLHSACYCGSGGNHLLGLPLIAAINAMVLSRFSVGGVLYLTCIPLLFA
jgi:hypothetical protein